MRSVRLAAVLLACAPFAVAGGINTDTALAVGRGTVVARTQFRYADLDAEIDRYLARQTVAYGVTGRLTAFTSLAHVWNDPGPDGLTDLALFGRYKLLARDARRQTRTFSGILGVEVPVGEKPIGGDDPGLIVGAVGTWYRNLWEVDADLVKVFRPDRGDLLRADVAVARGLHEARDWQLVGVLEANYSRTDSDDVLFVSPGLQLQLRGVILETSLQVRVLEDATAPTGKVVGVFGVRFVF